MTLKSHAPWPADDRARPAGPLRVRQAVVNDVSALVDLAREVLDFYGLPAPATTQSMAESIRSNVFGQRPTVEILVAEQERRILGFLVFSDSFAVGGCTRVIFIQDLFVTNRSRQNGLGQALMVALAALARERGIMRIDWTVDKWNNGAQAFYRRIGSRRTGEKLFYSLSGPALLALASSWE